MEFKENIKVGYVSFVGKPNVGKSSIINAIMKTKVVIVSEKPQTTRTSINVIYNDEYSQIIFTDTPGIHKPLHRLGEYMVKIAVQALKNVDLLLFTIDANEGFEKPEQYILPMLNASKKPVIAVINKIDLCKDEQKIDFAVKYIEESVENLVGIVKTSAVTGEGLDELLKLVKENIPYGPQLYPDDIITDRPLSFMISELIREKILHFTYEEIPHSTAVIIEEIKERENGVLYVRANIYVERESQKGIIIGKGGEMIKKIGQNARKDIEFLLDAKVYLDLFVKVKKDWRNKDFIILNEIGLRDDIERE